MVTEKYRKSDSKGGTVKGSNRESDPGARQERERARERGEKVKEGEADRHS